METLYHFAKNNVWIEHIKDEKPNPTVFGMHAHTFAELFYFISGNGVFHIEGTEYILQPDDILLMRPGESHYIEIGGNTPYERVVVSFPINIFNAIDAENKLIEPFTNRKNGEKNLYNSCEFTINSSPNYIRGILSCGQDDYLSLLSNFIPLLNEIRRIFPNKSKENNNNTLEHKILQYINQNIYTNLSLDSLCESFFINKQYLCRLFKKTTGTTIWQYITAKRMIAAHQLLTKGLKPKKVYSQVGFNDYTSFYRAYVKYFSASPGKIDGTEPPV